MTKRKDNVISLRLSDDDFSFIKGQFGSNLSSGFESIIDVYRQVMLLALVEIRKQTFTENELRSIVQLTKQTIESDIIELVAIQNGADPKEVMHKLDSLSRIVKSLMFQQVEMYPLEELARRFGVVMKK